MVGSISDGQDRKCSVKRCATNHSAPTVHLPNCSVAITDQNCTKTQFYQLCAGHSRWCDGPTLQDVGKCVRRLPNCCLSGSFSDGEDNSPQGCPFLDRLDFGIATWSASTKLATNLTMRITCSTLLSSYRLTFLSHVCQGNECLLSRKSCHFHIAIRHR